MAHVQLLNDKVVAIFHGAQAIDGYTEIGDHDARVVAFYELRAPAAESAVPDVDEQLAAMRKAILTGDKSDLLAIDSKEKG